MSVARCSRFFSLINKMSLWLCNTLSSLKPVLSFIGLFVWGAICSPLITHVLGQHL